MSLPVTFYALTPAQARAYTTAFEASMKSSAPKPLAPGAADDDWGEVLDPKSATSTEDILEEVHQPLQLDWQAFGLSYLLCCAAGFPYEMASLVPELFGDELGQGINPDGSTHCQALLAPARVSAAHAFICRFGAEGLRAHFDPIEMRVQCVHPMNEWAQPDTLDSLLAARDRVEAFYARALREGAWTVVAIAI